MDRMTGGPALSLTRAGAAERHELSHAPARQEHGVVHTDDDGRAAKLGELAKLPSLGEVLSAWTARIGADQMEDKRVAFNKLRLTPTGLLSSGKAGLPMTYRIFGHLIRGWCSPPRNVAQCLIRLRIAELPRIGGGPAPESSTLLHSPRSCAYNDYLGQRNERERSRLALTGENDEAAERVTIRTRVLRTALETPEGEPQRYLERRTVIGAVTDTHSGPSGDDAALIAALSIAFAGSSSTARAQAYRGIEESELRAVFPALEVEIPSTGNAEKWTAYLTARNSETGAKSWSISAGLYRTTDGATVACEAVQRAGRHVGERVAERMVEVANGAADLLRKLTETAAELAAKETPWSEDETLKKLRAAVAGTVLSEGDALCGLAWALGETVQRGKITVGAIMNALGRVAAECQTRAQAKPLEILAGRVLVDGWDELKAVATESEVES